MFSKKVRHQFAQCHCLCVSLLLEGGRLASLVAWYLQGGNRRSAFYWDLLTQGEVKKGSESLAPLPPPPHITESHCCWLWSFGLPLCAGDIRGSMLTSTGVPHAEQFCWGHNSQNCVQLALVGVKAEWQVVILTAFKVLELLDITGGLSPC